MNIKVYKGWVVPFPCEKSWKWMLEESVKRCNNYGPPDACIHVDCIDCVYNTAASRAEYYKHCFPERPKFTAEVFDRVDCPGWARWAAVDEDGAAAYYEHRPILLDEVWRYPEVDLPKNRWQYIQGGCRRFAADDWRNSLIERPVKAPKLTVEVFNRPDCPEWAQWAAVDSDGKAYWFSKKPAPKVNQWYRCAQDPGKYQRIENSTQTKFDALDWRNSIIERPAKRVCSACKEKEIKTFKGLVIPVPLKKEWTWDHNKGYCVAGGVRIHDCTGTTCNNCIYSSFHIKQFDEFYKYKYGTADKASCNDCKNYEPKDSPDREMIPVYEFDWYTQWKYSPSKDTYYYLEDLNKNRARELKTGELVNEIPADVIVVIPRDPSPATLISTAVQHVLTGNYYVIQKVEGDGSRIYVKDMDWEKSEFYKNFIDRWGNPVCYFERVTK